ncbi:hypothetical protein BC831DRAFT_455204 [Entophlyctis helioformis]|nr:hypothetical protein BC831DRAFT_455204 [Entophlyctis helioformis]
MQQGEQGLSLTETLRSQTPAAMRPHPHFVVPDNGAVPAPAQLKPYRYALRTQDPSQQALDKQAVATKGALPAFKLEHRSLGLAAQGLAAQGLAAQGLAAHGTQRQASAQSHGTHATHRGVGSVPATDETLFTDMQTHLLHSSADLGASTFDYRVLLSK